MANKKSESQSFVKQYWFVLVVAALLLVFIGLYMKDAIDNRPVTVNSKQVDGKYALLSIGEDYYMADELYETLSKRIGTSALAEQFTNIVLDKSIETTDEMKNFADNVAANYAYAKSDDVETMYRGMAEMGYEPSLDGLRQYCITYRKKIEMSKNYYNEHLEEYRDNIEASIKPMEVSHILIKTTVNEAFNDDGSTYLEAYPTEEESAKLNEVLKALVEGKDFAEVAKQYS